MKRINIWNTLLIICILMQFALFYIYYKKQLYPDINQQDGYFGDWVGGVLGTIIAGATAAVVLVAYINQNKANNKLAHDQIRTQIDTHYFKYLDTRLTLISLEKGTFEEIHSYFIELYSNVRNTFCSMIDEPLWETVIDVTYKMVYYGTVGRNRNDLITSLKYLTKKHEEAIPTTESIDQLLYTIEKLHFEKRLVLYVTTHVSLKRSLPTLLVSLRVTKNF